MRFSPFLFVVATACMVAAAPASAQARPTNGSDFPAAEFDSTDKTAYYFWQYDSFAWAATDKVIAEADAIGKALLDRLGEEWFCFKSGSTWHAVFGRFDDSTDTYDAVLHYVSTGSGAIARTTEPVDAALGNRFGRALFIAKRRVPAALARANIRFNSYVRERNDGSIDVLLIPSWQQSGWILYGSEFRYGFDAGGRNVTDSVVRVGDIKGARPDSTATITLAHDNEPGIPTLGQVLFIRLYTKYFAHVRVRTRDWVSELYKGPPEVAWFHALREEKSQSGQ
jgi:hypothetical protein